MYYVLLFYVLYVVFRCNWTPGRVAATLMAANKIQIRIKNKDKDKTKHLQAKNKASTKCELFIKEKTNEVLIISISANKWEGLQLINIFINSWYISF